VVEQPPVSPTPRARRTTAETLAIVAVIAWTAILGFIGGAFMDFGGDGKYRLMSSVESPFKAHAHTLSTTTHEEADLDTLRKRFTCCGPQRPGPQDVEAS